MCRRGRPGPAEPQWLYLLVKTLARKAPDPEPPHHIVSDTLRDGGSARRNAGARSDVVGRLEADSRDVPSNLGLEDAKHFHQQISAADRLRRAGAGAKPKSRGRGRL